MRGCAPETNQEKDKSTHQDIFCLPTQMAMLSRARSSRRLARLSRNERENKQLQPTP